MIWWVLIAVAVLVLSTLAWWFSGRSKQVTPPGPDRATRGGEMMRDHGPTNHPTNPPGV